MTLRNWFLAVLVGGGYGAILWLIWFAALERKRETEAIIACIKARGPIN